jgi:hypothetical protein
MEIFSPRRGAETFRDRFDFPLDATMTEKSSSAPSGPSSTSTPSSSAPLTPSTRRSLRLAQATTYSSSSSSKAPSQVPELYPRDYLEKEAKARRMFRKLAREYGEKHEMPNQESLDQLNSYNEILRDKIVGWRAEVSDSLRVEFFEGRLRVRLARHDNHDYLPLIVIISIIAITDDECAFGCNHNHDFLIVIICL